ncbi:protein shortage in chiasmata 1 ortholog isoform X1 [Nerophis lumbriciformis]|uniref:protein shortage in chiasmata 1 ortholog isoform X1 n=1 Tax=Nerophis lumbriciformis TaxID=546530 RepID=UPI002AE03C04|nr:protein shortage in chiasmata 1 ortholog isoform X1 [Nerophis lumbriciformis]
MSTIMFPSIRYKALDYDFEARSRLKVIMDVLALPTPYITGSHHLYPHSGALAGATYRQPWVRGNIISTCSSSALDHLRGTRRERNSPDRFHGFGCDEYELEVFVSSNADSAELPDPDKGLCLLEESEVNNPCGESFNKMTTEQMDPRNKNRDLLLLEEMMVADFLPHFKRHLPALKSKLSRLRTLPVADPLLSLPGDAMTEETILRHCVAYERPSDVKHGCPHLPPNITETFFKESPTKEEFLLLPELLDSAKIPKHHLSSFSSLCCDVNVIAEHLDEQLPVLEVPFKDDFPSVEMSPFSLPVWSAKEYRLKDTDAAGHAVLPTDLELDVTLSPPPATDGRQSHVLLRTCDLEREALSPPGGLCLVSAAAQQQMEMTLWKAEKHPDYVLSFLFTEPELQEAAVEFQPLSEALMLITLESFAPELETRVLFGSWRESPERLSADLPSFHDSNHMLEDFSNVSLEPDETDIIWSVAVSTTLLQPHLEESQNAAFPSKAETDFSGDKKCLKLTPNIKEIQPSTGNVDRTADKSGYVPAPCWKNVSQLKQSAQKVAFGVKEEDQRDVMASGRPAHQQVDPLTTFMMLRSQPVSPVPAAAPAQQEKATKSEEQQQPRPEDTRTLAERTLSAAAASGHATREQNNADAAIPPTDALRFTHDGSRVVEVQATDSQYQAYRELLAFAQPRLTSARELGLNLPAWKDFERLAPDQTRYVLRQQELALCRRTQAERGELVRDQEQLLRLVALVHMLVMAKELVFKCDLSAAAEYLSKAVETSADPSLAQLLRKLQIILYLSRRNGEANLKLLELQQLMSVQLRNAGDTQKDKILVIISLHCEDSTSAIIQHLSQLTAVTAVHPSENKSKLNGASVVSSVQESVCVMVYQQHLGPDFPWNLFSLVVEYDHPGPSPWATICKERKVEHLIFDTVLPESAPWCLEDKVAYVLLATETLLNCPLLLQALESTFNVSVLERSHCPSLQTLGGTDHYIVITVDERTAIMVQEQDELHQERASEVVVMRLTALSFQYTHCWIIVHCTDAGFSSQAFSNLVLVYSFLVLLGMKSEDLEVRVLIASEVSEVARWVNQICFLSLMSSGQDPVTYLDRDWLAVTCSREEQCVSQFPSINPLVAQLMLKRAPSLPWLLGASPTQLEELLPEVPHKVLKLFCDTASLCKPAESASPPRSPWTVDPLPSRELALPDPDAFPSDANLSFLFGAADASFDSQEVGANFRHDPTWPVFSPDVSILTAGRDARNEPHRTGEEEAMLSERRGRAGALGRVVERRNQEWSRWARGSSSAALGSPLILNAALGGASGRLSPPPEVQLWRRGGPPGRGSHVSAHYGSRCLSGQEMKRSEEAAGLPDVQSILLDNSQHATHYSKAIEATLVFEPKDFIQSGKC